MLVLLNIKYTPFVVAGHSILLVGSDDGWSPIEQHETMLNVITNSNLVVIEDAGHMTTMEKPEKVTNALRHWLMK